MGFGGRQARRRTHRAVHVLDRTALGADEMVVVVVDAQLEQPRTTRRLDAPDETGVDEIAECVVYGLQARVRNRQRDESEELVRARMASEGDAPGWTG